MKRMCPCCGKQYRDLPAEGEGLYEGLRVCKKCGRPKIEFFSGSRSSRETREEDFEVGKEDLDKN